MSREQLLNPSILDAIGSTPLVELSRITGDLDGRIFTTLDCLNPGRSKKEGTSSTAHEVDGLMTSMETLGQDFLKLKFACLPISTWKHLQA